MAAALEFVKIVGGFAAGYCTHLLLNRRADLKERVAAVVADIEELRDYGVHLWLGQIEPMNSVYVLHKIPVLSSKIGKTLPSLGQRYWTFHFDRHDLLTALRRAITADPFGGANFAPDPARAKSIEEDADELIEAVRDARGRLRLVRGP